MRILIDHWLFSTKDFLRANQASFLRPLRPKRIRMEACHDWACIHSLECLVPIESACHTQSELPLSHIWHRYPGTASSMWKRRGPTWIYPAVSNRPLANRQWPRLPRMLPHTIVDTVFLDATQNNEENHDRTRWVTVVHVVRGNQVRK